MAKSVGGKQSSEGYYCPVCRKRMRPENVKTKGPKTTYLHCHACKWSGVGQKKTLDE